MDPKIQHFQTFQKKGTYVIQLLVVYQCTTFQVNSSIFDTQMESFWSPNSYPFMMSFFSNDIFVTSEGRTQKQMTPLDSWAKTGQHRYLFVHIYKVDKLTFFDLTLTWPSLKTSKKGLRRPN